MERRTFLKGIFGLPLGLSAMSLLEGCAQTKEIPPVSLNNVKKVSEWVRLNCDSSNDNRIPPAIMCTTYLKKVNLTDENNELRPFVLGFTVLEQNFLKATGNLRIAKKPIKGIMEIAKFPDKEGEEGFIITDGGADGLRNYRSGLLDPMAGRTDLVKRLKKMGEDTKIVETFIFPNNGKAETRDRLDREYNDLLQRIIDTYKIDDFLAGKTIVIK